ncbi:RNA polymerase II transcription elongation factor-domain-containing protein [Tirmania nivea]|nr:RNA polymerase II transcription elongation factor-domain-containing protein [Tirmania nivea]
MPPVVAGAPRKMIDPVKPEKFSVKIGDSLKDPNSGRKRLTSLKYNYKPSSALNNGRNSTLKSESGGAGNEVTLDITPNDAVEPVVTFSGAQGPAKKTECVLIYDPATGTFTLEKLLSTFTLNLTSAGANLHPPLSLPTYHPGQSDDSGTSDDGSSDGNVTKANNENPFDYRNFINNKLEVPTSSSRLRDDKVRKQRFEKPHEELSDPNASAEDEDVEEDNGGLIIEESPIISTPAPIRQIPARPRAPPSVAAPKPRTKPTPKTSAANKKSSTNGSICLSSSSKKGAVPTEEIDITPSHPPISNKRPRDEVSSESDADNESDESDEDENEFAGSGELIVEGEDADDGRNNRSRSTTAGLGSSWIGGNRGGPVSSAAAQGDVEMDSDDEEEEMVAQSPISFRRYANVLDEDEESSDEDEEPYQQQARVQSAPTPNGDEDGEYEEEEEEEEEEYDLVGMLEEALDEGEEESESEEE